MIRKYKYTFAVFAGIATGCTFLSFLYLVRICLT